MIESLLVTFHKTSANTGTATLQFKDVNNEDAIVINQIGIDLNDGANPISIQKLRGVPIVQGTLIEDAKGHVLDLFTASDDLGVGIYQFQVDLWEEE